MITWTKQEIKWLKENYEELGLLESIKVLGKSSSSILHKASRLKLKRRGEGRKVRKRSYDGYEVVSEMGERYFTHRRVMEVSLGRRLTSNEIVRHIDGDKTNNSLDNLKVTSRAKHQGEDHRLDLEKRRDLATGQFKSKVEEIV